MKTKKLLLPSIIPLVIALFTVILTGCINTYYDGSNLLDIFQTDEYTVYAGIATTETDLKTLTSRNFKREFWLDSYGITSYRNKSMADAVSEHSIGDIHSNLEGKTFIPFLANEYVGGYAKGSNYPIDYYKFTLKKAGDIFVVATNDDTLSVSDSKMGIAKCLGNGKSYKQLTGTYKVSSSDGFYIYIPESIFNADTSQDSSYCIVKQYYRDSAEEYRYEKDDLYYKQYGYYTCYGKTHESKDYRISVVQTEK